MRKAFSGPTPLISDACVKYQLVHKNCLMMLKLLYFSGGGFWRNIPSII